MLALLAGVQLCHRLSASTCPAEPLGCAGDGSPAFKKDRIYIPPKQRLVKKSLFWVFKTLKIIAKQETQKIFELQLLPKACAQLPKRQL